MLQLLEVIPSLASANQACLKDEISRLRKDLVKGFHLDIEDGNFIPNITFGLKMIKDLRSITDLPFSVHLMTYNPERYLPELNKIGVTSVAVHLEVCKYPKEIINLAKNMEFKIGVALNPKTSAYELDYIMNDLDFVLIMTSEPDNKGQHFIYQMLQKVSFLSNKKSKAQDIWVDGGITKEILYEVWKAGANVAVMGRAIFNSEDSKAELERIVNMVKHFN